MEKLLRCSDLGFNCGFEACEDTSEKVLRTLMDHARAVHGMQEISEKDRVQACESIQDAFCVPKGGYNPGRGAT